MTTDHVILYTNSGVVLDKTNDLNIIMGLLGEREAVVISRKETDDHDEQGECVD